MSPRRVLVPAAVLGTLAGVGVVALLIRSSLRGRRTAVRPSSTSSVWSTGRRSHPAYRGAQYNGYNGFHAGGSDSYSATGNGPGDGCDSGTSC